MTVIITTILPSVRPLCEPVHHQSISPPICFCKNCVIRMQRCAKVCTLIKRILSRQTSISVLFVERRHHHVDFVSCCLYEWCDMYFDRHSIPVFMGTPVDPSGSKRMYWFTGIEALVRSAWASVVNRRTSSPTRSMAHIIGWT